MYLFKQNIAISDSRSGVGTSEMNSFLKQLLKQLQVSLNQNYCGKSWVDISPLFLLTSNFNLVFTIYFNGKTAACSI